MNRVSSRASRTGGSQGLASSFMLLALFFASQASVGTRLWGQDDLFQNLPPGVQVTSTTVAPAAATQQIGTKLGGELEGLTNSLLRIHGRQIKVNILRAKSTEDAKSIYEALLKIKSSEYVKIRGKQVIEYVLQDADPNMAIKTDFELGLVPKPPKATYAIQFETSPLDRGDSLDCNRLFNAMIQLDRQETAQLIAEVRRLAENMTFGNALAFRHPKYFGESGKLTLNPKPRSEKELLPQIEFQLASLPKDHGIPSVKVELVISTDETGFFADPSTPGAHLVQATSSWPAQDPEIAALAKKITAGQETHTEKVSAILGWLTPGRNIKYSGETGSRWGTKKALQQKYGHCWDFSDCFITLARAEGIPCRQVAGWLFGSSGHVWAEYYIPERGWQQVDPTGGGSLPCGIYHIAYYTTEDGNMPILYLSHPKIELMPR